MAPIVDEPKDIDDPAWSIGLEEWFPYQHPRYIIPAWHWTAPFSSEDNHALQRMLLLEEERLFCLLQLTWLREQLNRIQVAVGGLWHCYIHGPPSPDKCCVVAIRCFQQMVINEPLPPLPQVLIPVQPDPQSFAGAWVVRPEELMDPGAKPEEKEEKAHEAEEIINRMEELD